MSVTLRIFHDGAAHQSGVPSWKYVTDFNLVLFRDPYKDASGNNFIFISRVKS